MGVDKIRLHPGINTQMTRTLNEAGFSDGAFMRARDGLMECLGGWKPFPIGAPIGGRVTELHAWTDLAQKPRLAAGGNRLTLIDAGTNYDVSPIVQVHSVTNALSTTAGSAVVTLTDTSPFVAPGTHALITTTAAVGGLTINDTTGNLVLTSGNGSTGQFTASAAATSTATGGGTVTISYILNPGLYGSTFWSFDNWGQDLVACPQFGAIYAWSANSGSAARSLLIGGDSPLAALGVLVGMPERHLIAMGSAPPGGSTLDPLLVAFSDTENYTVWTATAFNAAGTFRIAAGSSIVAWKRTSAQILIWTDIGLVGMQYIGTPYIYGFNDLATSCGIIGPKAAVTVGNLAFWMTNLAFWSYDGQAATIPCTVRDRVFGNLNYARGALVCAALNGQFNEITWYFPSATATENDSYATYNYVDKTWVVGTLTRTAWIDASVVGLPIGAAADGTLYQHEIGYDAAGVALHNSLTTGFFDLGDGEEFSFLDQIIMDFADQNGPVNVTIQAQLFPNGPVTTKGPFAVQPSTPFISPRIRGRQIALKFDSVGVGTFWRLGALRVRIAGDGRR